MKTTIVLILILASSAAIADVCELDIKHQEIGVDRGPLVLSLLKLALAKTEFTACYTEVDQTYTLARRAQEVQKGNLTVVWAGTSPEIERELRAVRIPIFRGLLGYRVLVIRNGEDARFEHIETIEQLKTFRAGVGDLWPDNTVLSHAGIPVVTAAHGRRLWAMLAGWRFDFMPYSLHEVWSRISRHDFDLSVEKQLLLHYPVAFYFYVDKQRADLHNAITKGMELALKDGSYDKLLYSSSEIKNTVRYADISSRRIVHLDNPNLPKDTPLTREELWVKPKALAQRVVDTSAPTYDAPKHQRERMTP